MKKTIFLISMLLLFTGCGDPEPEPVFYTLFIQPTETVDFEIRDLENNKITEGTLGSTYWNEIEAIPEKSSYHIYYWNDESYVQFITINEMGSDLNIELVVGMQKGDINISVPDFKEGEIYLNIESEGLIMNPTVCIRHSLNILRVTPEQQTEPCEYLWYNYTNYTQIDDITEYQLIGMDKQRCSLSFKEMDTADNIRECDGFSENVCILKTYPRDNKYDVCFDIKTLNNENYSTILNVETISSLKNTDYLEINIYDQERFNYELRSDKIWDYSRNEVKEGTIIP